MPTTKPSGPHQLAAIVESTWAASAQALSLTSGWLRALKTDFGDCVTDKQYPQLTHAGRGEYHESVGGRQPVPFTVELTFQGSGTDATDLAGRTALMTAAGFTVATSGTVAYSLTANPVGGCMLYRVDRQGLFAEYLLGAIVQSCKFELNRSDIPKIIMTGVATKKIEFMATTLGAALATTDGTAITLSDAHSIRTGESTDTVSGLGIYVKIDSEILKITAFVRSTAVATVVRGQLGTSGATHLISAAVAPLYTGLTYEDGAADAIPGPHSWSVAIATLASDDVKALTINIATGRMHDEVTSGSDVASGIHNGALKVSGSLTYIQSVAKQMVGKLIDQSTACAIAVTLTSPGGDVYTLNVPYATFRDGLPKNPDPHELTELTASFIGKCSTPDLLDSFSASINVP